jgi:hypothetical protein
LRIERRRLGDEMRIWEIIFCVSPEVPADLQMGKRGRA